MSLLFLSLCAGGSISGAVFNPVLAFSVQFPCSGHTYLEYCFVYWLGPVLGKEQNPKPKPNRHRVVRRSVGWSQVSVGVHRHILESNKYI